LQAGFGKGGTGWEFDWNKAWNGAISGLQQGIISVGLDYASQELNINPLLAEFGFTAVAGLLEGLFDFSSNAPPVNRIFDKIWEGYKNAALNIFQLGMADPTDPWQQAAYTANIMNFSEIVQEKGLLNAIETYATSMFRQSTIQSMITLSGSVSNWIQQQLDDPTQYITEIKDGKELKYIKLPGVYYDPDLSPLEQEYLSLLMTEGEENVFGLKEGDFERWGIFGVDELDNWGLLDGDVIQWLEDDVKAWQKMEDGYLSYVDLCDADGNIILVISPDDEGGYIIGRDFNEWLENKFSTDDFEIVLDKDDLYETTRRIYLRDLDETTQDLLKSFGMRDDGTLGEIAYYLDSDGTYSFENQWEYILSDEMREIFINSDDVGKLALAEMMIALSKKDPIVGLFNAYLASSLTPNLNPNPEFDLAQFKIFDANYVNDLFSVSGNEETTASFSNLIRILKERYGVSTDVINGVIGYKYSSGELEMENGMRIMHNVSSGIYYKGSAIQNPFLGIFNQNCPWPNSDGQGHLRSLIFYDQLNDELSVNLISKSGGSFYNFHGNDKVSFERSDYGAYTVTNTPLFATENSNYITQINGKSWIGMRIAGLDTFDDNRIDDEKLLFLDDALKNGERVPVTDDEKFVLLVYQSRMKEITSLTVEEEMLIYDQFSAHVHDMLDGYEKYSASDIDRIALSLADNLIETVKGKSYNDYSYDEDYMLKHVEYGRKLEEYKQLLALIQG